jgi:hypothetical protein
VLICNVGDPSVGGRIERLLRQPIFGTLADAIEAVDVAPAAGHWIHAPVPAGLLAPFDAMATVAEACQRWDVRALAGRARASTFNLCVAAFRCPPGQVSVAALLARRSLRISFRVHLDADHRDASCTTSRQPTGIHHQVTATGHILWARLPVVAAVDADPDGRAERRMRH